MVKINFRAAIPDDAPSLDNHKEYTDETVLDPPLLDHFRTISEHEPSKLCGLKHEDHLKPNSCQRLICPRCGPRRANAVQGVLTTRLAAQPDLVLYHLTLTARQSGRDLATAWDTMQTALGNGNLRKHFERKTSGIYWADGVTLSSAGVWFPHRHMVLAVTPDQVDKLPSLVAAWLETAPIYGLSAHENGQSLRPVQRKNAYAVFGYVAQQLSPQHLTGDPLALGPGDLLERSTHDPEALMSFLELERAIFNRQSIGARGVLAKQSTDAD